MLSFLSRVYMADTKGDDANYAGNTNWGLYTLIGNINIKGASGRNAPWDFTSKLR